VHKPEDHGMKLHRREKPQVWQIKGLKTISIEKKRTPKILGAEKIVT
jgi:hypothetical protein